MSAPRYGVAGYWFVFRLDRDRWPVECRNELGVILTRRDPGVTPEVEPRDVELEVKY